MKIENYDADQDVKERIDLLGRDAVVQALSRRRGLPGVNPLSLGIVPIDTHLADIKPRFDKSYWFAKPPEGTPWPTLFTHHTFETCWLSRHDKAIGDPLHLQVACMPRQAQMLMIWQICGIGWWIENNGVTVFPEDRLVEACANTDVLDCVDGSDVRPAYPYLMFGLSDKRRIENDDGTDWINYVLVNFIENGKEENVKVGSGTLMVKMPQDCERYVILSAFWKSGFVSSFAIPLRNHETLRDTIARFSTDYIDDEFRGDNLSKEQLDQEHAETSRVGRTIASMVFNLCLLMQSYPEYVKRRSEKNDRQMRFRTKPPPATYGVNDRTAPLKPPPVVEGRQPHDDDTSDDQRTVKPHWRRGHWKRQTHSSEWEVANPQVKVVLFADGRHAHMVWIRPVFVRGRRGE